MSQCHVIPFAWYELLLTCCPGVKEYRQSNNWRGGSTSCCWKWLPHLQHQDFISLGFWSEVASSEKVNKEGCTLSRSRWRCLKMQSGSLFSLIASPMTYIMWPKKRCHNSTRSKIKTLILWPPFAGCVLSTTTWHTWVMDFWLNDMQCISRSLFSIYPSGVVSLLRFTAMSTTTNVFVCPFHKFGLLLTWSVWWNACVAPPCFPKLQLAPASPTHQA